MAFGDAAFSVLYSGIGDKYYATCRQGEGLDSKEGWIRLPVTSRTWDVSNVASELPAGSRVLGFDQLENLEAIAAKDMAERLLGEETTANAFAILPTWSVARMDALAHC